MRGDDVVGDGQAQSRALAHRLGGEEWVEDPTEEGLWNSRPGIAHFDDDLPSGVGPRANTDLVLVPAPFWNRLRAFEPFKAALRGINAAVVGILLAALYQPIWTSAISVNPASQ